MRDSIVAAAERACGELTTDLLVLPELTLSGYPPEDLLFHRGFRVAIERGMETVRGAKASCGVVVGFPEYAGSQIFNSAALIEGGTVRATHRKSCLPNYKVFDEKRYFKSGAQPTVVEFRGFRVGTAGLRGHLGAGAGAAGACGRRGNVRGAERLAVRNAQAGAIARTSCAAACATCGCRWCTSTCWAARTSWCSTAIPSSWTPRGTVVMRAPPFEEGLYPVEFERVDGVARPVRGPVAPELSDAESVYRALVLGVRDYVGKHGFPGVVMGLVRRHRLGAHAGHRGRCAGRGRACTRS